MKAPTRRVGSLARCGRKVAGARAIDQKLELALRGLDTECRDRRDRIVAFEHRLERVCLVSSADQKQAQASRVDRGKRQRNAQARLGVRPVRYHPGLVLAERARVGKQGRGVAVAAEAE